MFPYFVIACCYSYYYSYRHLCDIERCGYTPSHLLSIYIQVKGGRILSTQLEFVIFLFVLPFLFSFSRHYKLEAEIANMTWKIRWEELHHPKLGARGQFGSRGSIGRMSLVVRMSRCVQSTLHWGLKCT